MVICRLWVRVVDMELSFGTVGLGEEQILYLTPHLPVEMGVSALTGLPMCDLQSSQNDGMSGSSISHMSHMSSGTSTTAATSTFRHLLFCFVLASRRIPWSSVRDNVIW